MINITPGPWETSVGPWDNGTDRLAWAVCIEGGGDIIAEIEPGPEAEANARAIAEVPTMIEMLRSSHGALDVLAEDSVEAGYLFRAEEATELAMSIRTLLTRINRGPA